jgi:hypothetical protein
LPRRWFVDYDAGPAEAAPVGFRAAEKGILFVDTALNPAGLRPSIETCLHALLAVDVVAHVHRVDTIALAVRRDGCREPSWLENIELRAKKAIKWGLPHFSC